MHLRMHATVVEVSLALVSVCTLYALRGELRANILAQVAILFVHLLLTPRILTIFATATSKHASKAHIAMKMFILSIYMFQSLFIAKAIELITGKSYYYLALFIVVLFLALVFPSPASSKGEQG